MDVRPYDAIFGHILVVPLVALVWEPSVPAQYCYKL